MFFTNRKDGEVTIEVKQGVSSDGSLNGRFYSQPQRLDWRRSDRAGCCA